MISIVYPISVHLINNIAFNGTEYFFTASGIQMIQLIISLALLSKGLICIWDFVTIWYSYVYEWRKKRVEFDFIHAYSTNITVIGILLIYGSTTPLIWIAGKLLFEHITIIRIYLLFGCLFNR